MEWYEIFGWFVSVAVAAWVGHGLGVQNGYDMGKEAMRRKHHGTGA